MKTALSTFKDPHLGSVLPKFGSLLLLLSLVSCNGKPGPQGPRGVEGVTGASQPRQMTGSTSGGGGYGSEPGHYLLRRVRDELVNELRLLNPAVFARVELENLKTKIEGIVSSLEADSRGPRGELQPVVRDGEELYFDYYTQGDSQRIVATKLFFDSLVDFEYSELPESEIVPKVRFFKVRALHEALHHLGIGTSKETNQRARVAAEAIIEAIETNNLVCSASTNEMPTEYFRFWQRYRAFDPIFKEFCADQIQEKAGSFFESQGMKHTNGTRMDLQISGEIVEQRMLWVINRPTGMGLYDPNYDREQSNAPGDQFSEARLRAIEEGTYKFLSNHDSDKRPETEEFPFYVFRSPLSYFASYDFSLESNPSYEKRGRYLDWQEAKVEADGTIRYSSSDKTSAFVVKSSEPITWSENFICDTQIYYESYDDDLSVEPGQRIGRFDLSVSEEIEVPEGDVARARVVFKQSISSLRDFNLGPWSPDGVESSNEGYFEISCGEYFRELQGELFTPDI